MCLNCKHVSIPKVGILRFKWGRRASGDSTGAWWLPYHDHCHYMFLDKPTTSKSVFALIVWSLSTALGTISIWQEYRSWTHIVIIVRNSAAMKAAMNAWNIVHLAEFSNWRLNQFARPLLRWVRFMPQCVHPYWCSLCTLCCWCASAIRHTQACARVQESICCFSL